MKTKSIISLLTLVLSASLLTTSCEDMLSPDLERYATEEKFGQDSIYSALGILRSIQRVAERTIILDACRSDLVTGGTYTTDSLNDVLQFNNPQDGTSALLNVADYYHVVNSCNFYLANVDTTITQNNKQIMQREWAQVQAMRAWAYIQLVRLYGEVPFVTTPVGSTDEAEAQSKNAPKVNAQNLVSSLVENGLARAYELQRIYGIPDYGNFNNGVGTTNKSVKNFFPVELVLGDAYLMANDYESAANYYYEHFVYNSSSMSMNTNNENRASSYGREGNIVVSSGDARKAFLNNSNNDNITFVSSAATPANGTVLTQVHNVFGAKTEITQSGVTVTPNEQYMQLLPSNQYVSLNRAQRFNIATYEDGNFKIEEAQTGDGRLLAYAPTIEMMTGSRTRFVEKYAVGQDINMEGFVYMTNRFVTNYYLPMYRVSVIQLRFAEAINRLGFTELAFGILKDGIITQNIPEYDVANLLKNDSVKVNIMDTEADTLIRTEYVKGYRIGKLLNEGISARVDYTLDSTAVMYEPEVGDTIYAGCFIPLAPHDSISALSWADIPQEVSAAWSEVEYQLEPKNLNGGMYYLSLEQNSAMQKYPFLDFSGSVWSKSGVETDEPRDGGSQLGVHARGCGAVGGRCDTIYTYARQVAYKIAEEHARLNGLSYAEQVAYAETLYDGETLNSDIDKQTIINAVENLIVDELALETAFESNRFGDLVRIAGHKDNSGQPGTEWLAWKIARRDKNFTDDASNVDAALQSKLLNKQNWYLSLPK